MNRKELRFKLARLLEGRGFAEALVSSLSGDNIRSADLASYPPDFFNDGEVTNHPTSGASTTTRIHDFKVQTITPPGWGEIVPYIAISTAAITAGDTLEVHPNFGWTYDQFNDAILIAWEAIKEFFLTDKVDESNTLDSDQKWYAVTSGFRYVRKLQYNSADSGATPVWVNILPDAWDTVPEATSALYVDSPVEGKTLRVIGLGPPAEPTADTTDIDFPEVYALYKAASALLLMQPCNEARNFNDQMRLANYYHELAEKEVAKFRNYIKPNSRAVVSLG